ncbi:hypothetical protein DEV91_106119 [Phyllobacterium brassicacearum]|nr:hypothetical protein DEV91_106119 [Phyllobacterium brassicacearum]
MVARKSCAVKGSRTASGSVFRINSSIFASSRLLALLKPLTGVFPSLVVK